MYTLFQDYTNIHHANESNLFGLILILKPIRLMDNYGISVFKLKVAFISSVYVVGAYKNRLLSIQNTGLN